MARGDKAAEREKGARHAAEPDILILEQFLPYRLAVVANQVSAPLAREYVRRYNLAVPEWRALAVLSRYPDISFTELVERSAVDKVAMSRAIANLEKMKRIERRVDDADRRRIILRLSEAGWEVYRHVVPHARKIDKVLLDAFTAEERDQLFEFLKRIQARVKTLDHAAIK